MNRPTLAALLTAIIVALGAGTFIAMSDDLPNYRSITYLLDALERGGLACDDEPGSTLPVHGGRTGGCEIDGRTVSFAVFENRASLDDALTVAPAEAALVVGDNWFVEAGTEGFARRIRDQIGGEVR